MAFKKKLIDGILSYVYYKIAEEGRFTVRFSEEFLRHVLGPFLSYYMSEVSLKVHEGYIVVKGSSLVPVSVEFKTPVIRDEEIIVPFKMNKLLRSFIATFGSDRMKPLRIEQDTLVIPAELLYNALKDMAEDLKVSKINIKEGEVEVEIVSRK